MSELQSNQEKLFGTDGIRGTPGTYPLTDKMLERIALGIAHCIITKRNKRTKPCVCIGKDTRLTGDHLETILSRTLCSQGMVVSQVGTITTPGLAYLTKNLKCDMGIMISASHNKPSDNGIKMFDNQGYKLSAQKEEEIEDFVFLNKDPVKIRLKAKIQEIKNSRGQYVKFLLSTVKDLNLKGYKICLDCAWGAAAPFARRVFTELGAKVLSIHDSPSGHHINKGGAVNPYILRELVLKNKADIGIAVDGDGDRGILIDDKGLILDGDCIMSIIASHMLKKNELPQNTIVATVMSNLALKNALNSQNGKIIVTNVGDKHVLEALIKHKLTFGGEQSGHIIFMNYLSAPDGLLTALQMLKVMRESNKALSILDSNYCKYPQLLINVEVKEKKPFEEIPALNERLNHFNSILKDEGRILLRYSGTESLARVMVEGKSQELINNIGNDLADIIKKSIGL